MTKVGYHKNNMANALSNSKRICGDCESPMVAEKTTMTRTYYKCSKCETTYAIEH